MAKSEDIANARPIDRAAGLVVGRGEHWTHVGNLDSVVSDTPLPTKKLPRGAGNMGGVRPGLRRGALVVVGFSANVSGRWVCRCDCGRYILRKTRALRADRVDIYDGCDSCSKVKFMREDVERVRKLLARKLTQPETESDRVQDPAAVPDRDG